MPLTARQREILEFVTWHARQHGVAPTVRQIGAHFGIRSPNGVVCHLKALESKGAIERRAGRTRTILVTAAGEAALTNDSPPLARNSAKNG